MPTKATKAARPAVKTKAVRDLPPLAYPKATLCREDINKDLRVWLLKWIKSRKRGPNETWITAKDRNISLCDLTLAYLAPFMIELLAERTGVNGARKLLAERFSEWPADEYWDWVYGYDVNVYDDENGEDAPSVIVGVNPRFSRYRKAA